MRKIAESIDVGCSPERLFRTLHTPTEICLWWNARTAIVIPRPGGIWAAAWGKDEDHPDYITIARMTTFEPPRRLVMADFEYHSGDKPLDFSRELAVEFRIEPLGDSARLTVEQSGFPEDASADEFYRGCCQGWKNTLAAIRDFF